MLTKAEEARVANDKARINDLVSTEVLASYGKDGQLDKEQLLTNLKRIPGVRDLPDTVAEMEFDKDHPLKFTVDGYDVTVEWTGKVTVGDSSGGESTPPTPVEPETPTTVTWSQNGDTITGSDNTVVKVGDKILNYDPKKGATQQTETSSENDNGYSSGDRTYNLTDFTGGWIVLGADETSGQLIITTDDVIKAGGSQTLGLKGATGYAKGIGELEKISKLYGQGEFADKDKTRSINVDDIDDVTGYNPERAGNQENNPYGKGAINQYGNKVTYRWETYQSKVKYESSVKNGSGSYSKFQYPNEDGSVTDLASGASKEFTSNYYYYYPNTLTSSNSAAEVGSVKKGTQAYKALFQNSSGTNVSYWLGSQYVSANGGCVYFGMRVVGSSGCGYGYSLFYSSSGGNNYYFSVRPAVYLKSGIKLAGDNSRGWAISEGE